MAYTSDAVVTEESRAALVADHSRLAAVRETALLDTPAEVAFDRLTRLASRILSAPISLVSLVDGSRDFWKSCIGVPEPFASAREIRLKPSFCQHALTSRAPLVVNDATLDPAFASFPAVSTLGVRAYLGIPLVTEDGTALGSFCVLDTVPRQWTPEDIALVTDLAAVAMTEIELRASVRTATRLTLLMRQQTVELKQQMEDARVTSDQLARSNETLKATGLVLEERQNDALRANVRIASALGAAQSAKAEAEVAQMAAQDALAAASTAQAAAEAANRVKGMFLASMSHELRTPLNAIAGHVQLIEMGIHGPVTPKQQEALNRVMVAQHHLLGLINDVLNFAKLDSGTVMYDIQPVVLAEVMADAASMIEQQVQSKDLTLVVKLPDQDIAALADLDKLRQILINLLSNAMKFTLAGGELSIEIATRAESGQAADIAYVRVADTGIGIAADQLASIFEPFVQVSATNISRREGTGLGLAISRDLARGMGGDLRVRSTPGEGSSFTVSLPRHVG